MLNFFLLIFCFFFLLFVLTLSLGVTWISHASAGYLVVSLVDLKIKGLNMARYMNSIDAAQLANALCLNTF